MGEDNGTVVLKSIEYGEPGWLSSAFLPMNSNHSAPIYGC
jgi:hypothetical protein